MASGSDWVVAKGWAQPRGRSGITAAMSRRDRYKLSAFNARTFRANATESGVRMFNSGNYSGAMKLGDAMVAARKVGKRRR